MDEYITKEQIADYFRSYDYLEEPIWFDELVNRMREIPAADVAPVRRGRWVAPKGIIECSECGFGMFPDGYFFEFGECKHAHESQYRPNHCPNCGARMDSEDKA